MHDSGNNVIELNERITEMNKRLAVIESETVPVVQELKNMAEAIHEVVEILRDIRVFLSVLGWVADKVKKLAVLGGMIGLGYAAYEYLDAQFKHYADTYLRK